MWRIAMVAWYTVLLALLGVLGYYSVDSALDSFGVGNYRDILGDGTALALFGLVAIWGVRRICDVLHCPSESEWRKRIVRDLQMYL